MFKSLSLASHNWKVLLISTIYQLLLVAFIFALGFTLFGNLAYDVVSIFNENHISEFVTQSVNSIWAGEFHSAEFTAQLNEVISNIQDSISSVRLPWGGATMSYVVFVLILVLYRVLTALTDVAVVCQLDEFMTSNTSRLFSWFFIKKQDRIWQYVLLITVFTLPVDILILTGCIGFYLMFLIAFRWWTIIPVVGIAVLFYVIRLTLFAFCLPAVACEDMPTRLAFRHGLSVIFTRFWRVFWKNLVVVLLMAVVTLISVLFIQSSVLSALVTLIPAFILVFYLKCVNVVEYFHSANRPFFYKRVDIEGTDRHNRKLQQQAKRQNRS